MTSSAFCRALCPALLLACLSLLATPHAAQAQDDDLPAVTNTYAITNARVVQAPGQVLDRATVVIRDGLIVDVGADAAIPVEAETIAGDSLTVYAGFIDGLSHAGVTDPETSGDDDVEDPGNPPLDRAGIQPDRDVRALLDPSENSVEALRKAGFTAAHAVPQGRMLPGTGALVLLAGADGNAMVLRDQTALFAQFEGARGGFPNTVYPSTAMAVISQMRQIYREAERRKMLTARYNQSPRGMERPPSDAAHTALFPVIDGERPVFFHTEGFLEMYRALDLQTELGFPVALTGLNQAYKGIDALQAAGAPLFLTLDLPEAEEEDAPADTAAADTTEAPPPTDVENQDIMYDRNLRVRVFEDTEAEEENLGARQVMTQEEYFSNAAAVHEAGLPFGFTSMGASAGDIPANLHTMVEHGLPEGAALAALTTDAAELLGVSDQLGTVETGKIANLVLTDGNYFAEDTKVMHVFVDGHKFDYASADASAPVSEEVAQAALGTWDYTVSTPGGEASGTIEIARDGDTIAGTISSPQGEATDLKNLSLDGQSLSFEFDGGQQVGGQLSVSVTLDGETFEGSVSVPNAGSFPITGERTSGPEA